MKFKRKMYESNPNIVERVEQLSLLIHNCNVYGISKEIKQKYIDELEQWVE